MKTKLLPLFTCVAKYLAAVAGFGCVASTAAIIDFNGISDGTLVSAGNPHLGVVNLTALSVTEYTVSGSLPTLTLSNPGIVQGGVVALVPQDNPGAVRFVTSLTADFLTPVTDVSFDVAAYRHGVYEFVAVDDTGHTITGGPTKTGTGGLETLDPHHIVVPLPAGYSLVKLDIFDVDPGLASASMWIDNLAFTANVPDSGSYAMQIGMISLGLGCMALRRKTRVN